MSLTRVPLSRIVSVFGFVALFCWGLGYYLTEVGAEIPGITATDDYQVAFRADDVKNLQVGGDVSIAGVVVGEVSDQQVSGPGARVVLDISPEAAPLHQGAHVRVGMKSVVGQSYVDVVDGDGAVIPSGAALPGSAVQPTVDIDEVISTFDPGTRRALRGTLRSLGAATAGTARDVDRMMTGLGDLGREGHTALQALAAQSGDLQALTREATVLLNALDTGRGQISTVVRDAQRLTEATAGQRAAIARTVRAMPALTYRARAATAKLEELAVPLTPVAADLERAAPELNRALVQLPSVSRDLRGLLPALDATLDRAPATLDRIPPVGADVRALIPRASLTLRDVNPALTYVMPFGTDIGAMFASFGASMDVVAENGVRPVRLAPIFNTGTIRGNPAPITRDPFNWNNPYPRPGQAGHPAPFRGEYPRVERARK